jgi:Galactosyltransferase
MPPVGSRTRRSAGIPTRRIAFVYAIVAFPSLVIVSWWSLQSLDHAMPLDRMMYPRYGDPLGGGGGDGSARLVQGWSNQDSRGGPSTQADRPSGRGEDGLLLQNRSRASNQPPKGQWLERIRQQQQEMDRKKRSQYSHPDFVQAVKDARVHLVESSQKVDLSIGKDAFSWELAPLPTNHSGVFETFFLPPPRVQPNVTTAVVVLSSHENFLRREAIRKTWGIRYMTFFVVGHSRNDETTDDDHRQLIAEQMMYADLIEVPLVESYAKLPEKVVQAYRWTLLHIPKVRWIVKVDDDSFVRPASLNRYLDKYNSDVPILIGKIIPHSRPAQSGKWAEHEWLPEFYPYWAIGSAGHIVSRRVVQYVVENSASLHRYQGEDVSLGIWLHEWEQSVTYIQASSMITNDGVAVCGTPRYMMIGHDLTLDEMYHCFLQYRNASLFNENTWVDEAAAYAELVKIGEGEEADTVRPVMENDKPFVSRRGQEKESFNNLSRENKPMGYSSQRGFRGHIAKAGTK